jgi:bifunctional non-homologous end joining protein LigD
MAKLGQPDSPFAGGGPAGRDTTWVKPELVAQVAFTEWTRDGRLRHPRYLGLRDDKPAREVVRERPS